MGAFCFDGLSVSERYGTSCLIHVGREDAAVLCVAVVSIPARVCLGIEPRLSTARP